MDEPEVNPDLETDGGGSEEDEGSNQPQKAGKKSAIFRSYPSITNVDTHLMMAAIKDEGHTISDVEWVLTEKVHGANFQFILNEEGLHCGKRSGLLEPGDRFYGWEKVRDIEAPKVALARDFLRGLDQFKGITHITVFGELFGGMYPHKGVPKEEGTVHVQKGVYYCPSVKFYAFDIFIPGHSFLSFDLFTKVCETAGFLYATPLLRGGKSRDTCDQMEPMPSANHPRCWIFAHMLGKYDDLIKFDYQTFVTRLPGLFGLPPLIDDPNIAEGVVLKPVNTCYLKKGGRVIIKLKSDKFKEVCGMVKGVGKVKIPGAAKVKPPTDPEILEHFNEMCRYINENRLRAVVSKIGDIKMKDRGKLTGLLAQDAIEDYAKDVPSWGSVIKEKQKLVTKKIQQLVANLVNEHIKAIAEGTF